MTLFQDLFFIPGSFHIITLPQLYQPARKTGCGMFIGRNFASVYSKMISQTIITFGSPKRKGLKLILVILMVLGGMDGERVQFFFWGEGEDFDI